MSNQIALVVRRTIKASATRVFEAWTRAEQLRQWWGPRPVRFEPRDGGTEVVVVHERIDSEATRDDHQNGWNGCLDNLAELFATG